MTEPMMLTVRYSAYPDPSFKWCVPGKHSGRSRGPCSSPDFPLSCVRLKNGQVLKDNYRIKQRGDSLLIQGVTETDAGNYTIVLTNKITKEEKRRFFQLLVNGTCPPFFASPASS